MIYVFVFIYYKLKIHSCSKARLTLYTSFTTNTKHYIVLLRQLLKSVQNGIWKWKDLWALFISILCICIKDMGKLSLVHVLYFSRIGLLCLRLIEDVRVWPSQQLPTSKSLQLNNNSYCPKPRLRNGLTLWHLGPCKGP